MVAESVFLLDLMRVLGEAEEPPTFVPDGTDYARDAVGVRAIVEHAIAPGGLVDHLDLAADSRASLEADARAVAEVEMRLSSGGTATDADVAILRTGAQRVICFSVALFPEGVCNAF